MVTDNNLPPHSPSDGEFSLVKTPSSGRHRIVDISDPFTRRLINLGMVVDREMSNAFISKCNCMVRYNGGPQIPAIRRDTRDRYLLGRGNWAPIYKFFTPEEEEIAPPTSFELMTSAEIKKLMDEQNEVYVGHMFGVLKP